MCTAYLESCSYLMAVTKATNRVDYIDNSIGHKSMAVLRGDLLDFDVEMLTSSCRSQSRTRQSMVLQ